MSATKKQALPNGPLLLGVDGGGTKTVAWLACLQEGNLIRIGVGQGGPSNPRAVGFELALRNLERTTQLALKNARLPKIEMDVACLCLAGTGRQQEKDAVLDWARQTRLARRAVLVSEAEAVLAEAASQRLTPLSQNLSEVALICGTGSLAWGRSSPNSTPVRSGGWGYLLGDEGSGFWLGQQVLQLACKSADYRANEVGILESVLKHLELQSAEALVSWCYEQPSSRERIASLAPLAFTDSSVAIMSDRVNRGAHELAVMISTVVRRLNNAEYDLALAGSVVVNQADYRNLIVKHLDDLNCPPVSVQLVEQPVSGALQLAARQYNGLCESY